MTGRVPVVVIVGGGFAGLAAAKALRRAPVRIVLIDRSNHHVFRPLVYRVAICALSIRQEFEVLAPGLKSLADAVAIRNKVLFAFEQAEAEEDDCS